LLVVLAGGALRARPATLLGRSRLIDALGGRPALPGAVGGALLGLDPLDGRTDPLPVGPLGPILRLGTEGPVRISDVVGLSVLLDLGGGLPPDPSAPGRRGHRPQHF
jgi:hypothetical protein